MSGKIFLYVGCLVALLGVFALCVGEGPIPIIAGLSSVVSGLFLVFYGEIGKAVNQLRVYTIADFNLRHGQAEEAAPASLDEARKRRMPRLSTTIFQVGEEVVHKFYGTKMKVEAIEGNKIVCDRGLFAGYAKYDASELKRP